MDDQREPATTKSSRDAEIDARADEANIRKAAAQVEKDRADLASATRNLDRQKELFRTKFISQAALDQAATCSTTWGSDQ